MLTRAVHHLEEGFIALLLALMTVITFSQVVARYFFSTGFGWALELTTYLFAWLVLFGISYGIKVGAHIGIDVVVRQFPLHLRRIVGLIGVLCCCAYCIILLVGATQYVYKPVSYTHLDVYKRQQYGPAITVATSMTRMPDSGKFSSLVGVVMDDAPGTRGLEPAAQMILRWRKCLISSGDRPSSSRMIS